MDSTDPVFAHQIEVVRLLATKFPTVDVITNKYNKNDLLPSNVKVFEVNWKKGDYFRNIYRFFKVIRRIDKYDRNLILFSHMTEVYSVLLIPWSVLHAIPHYLWYAHKSKSIYLVLCHRFLNGIITSTLGSCPIQSEKIHVVGQGVDESIFFREFSGEWNLKHKMRAIHIGRLDPSKQIEKLILHTLVQPNNDYFSSLTLIGRATPGNELYEAKLRQDFQYLIESGKLNFFGPSSREELPLFLSKADVFIHAFSGSLDKTLVEATMFGLPVITCNTEYLLTFGCWGEAPGNFGDDHILNSELSAFRNTDLNTIKMEVLRRQKVAIDYHSLSQWIEKVHLILSRVSA